MTDSAIKALKKTNENGKTVEKYEIDNKKDFEIEDKNEFKKFLQSKLKISKIHIYKNR